jgi:hypothetical protein
MVELAVRRWAGEVPAEGTTLMHDLIPLGPALPGALTTAEIDAPTPRQRRRWRPGVLRLRRARLRRLVRSEGRRRHAGERRQTTATAQL